MNRIKFSLLATLFILLAFTTQAQLKDGEIVRIKNVKSGKYAKPTNPPVGGPDVNRQIVLFTRTEEAGMKWKAIAVTGGYFKFQNLETNKFLGVLNRSKEQYGFICLKNEMIPRPLNVTPINNEDLYWQLEKTATGYKLKNKNAVLSTAFLFLIEAALPPQLFAIAVITIAASLLAAPASPHTAFKRSRILLSSSGRSR